MIIREEQIPQFTKFPDCSRYMSGDVSTFQTNALDFYKVFRSGDSIQRALLGVQQTLNLVDEPCLSITGGNKPFGIFRLWVWRKVRRACREWRA